MTGLPLSFPPVDAMVEDLKELGVDIEKKQLDLFGKFAEILLERSALTNLIGPAESNRLWRRHFLESAAYANLIDFKKPVVDIGSGNGFPGIVLAILGFEMTLLEPRRNRYLFLEYAVKKLDLENCSIVPERLEDFVPEKGMKQFVARAVAPPASLLEIIESTTGKDSILIYRQPEIIGNSKYENFFELSYPPLDRSGFLVQYRV